MPNLRMAPVIAIVASIACSSPAAPPIAICESMYTPAVSVVAVDSLSGIPLAGAATGVLSGASSDTLYHGSTPGDSILFGGLVAGTYTVMVSRAGYDNWVKSGIAVTPNGVCHELNTVDLRARMVPTP